MRSTCGPGCVPLLRAAGQSAHLARWVFSFFAIRQHPDFVQNVHLCFQCTLWSALAQKPDSWSPLFLWVHFGLCQGGAVRGQGRDVTAGFGYDWSWSRLLLALGTVVSFLTLLCKPCHHCSVDSVLSLTVPSCSTQNHGK